MLKWVYLVAILSRCRQDHEESANIMVNVLALLHTYIYIPAGSICNDFIMALQNIPNSAKVVHIGCRDKERAVKLVDKLGERESGWSFVIFVTLLVAAIAVLHKFIV